MSAPPERVADSELAFFFQTNEPIPARPLLTFIAEVERIARSRRHLGPDALVEITEIQTGTKLVRLTFGDRVAVAALGISVIGLGNDIASRFTQPQGRLPEAVAEMCIDNGVVECVITTPETQIRISRPEITAIATVEDKRTGRSRRRHVLEEGLDPSDFEQILENQVAKAQSVPERELDVLRSVSQQESVLSERRAARDGRIYTLIGELFPPGMDNDEWLFKSLSGKTYKTRGIREDRPSSRDQVVVRAERAGFENGMTVLMVREIMETEEP